MSISANQCLRGKPFLRWAGSKRKQVTRLASFWYSRSHKRYVEPFAGSACLFFELEPESAVLGDNNRELIEVYRVVRDEPDQLYRRLCHIRRNLETYSRWRKLRPNTLDRQTRALRFIYLNRNCFNGIYRTNLKGEFNVPMGKRLGQSLSRIDLVNCSELLQKAKLVAGDFSKTLEHVRKDDFVYLDPPYAVTSRRIFREYGKTMFSISDMARFSKELISIDDRGADFIVSYADSSEGRKLAKEWYSIRVPVRRHIAGFAENRRNAYEWLISNHPIDKVMLQNSSRKQGD